MKLILKELTMNMIIMMKIVITSLMIVVQTVSPSMILTTLFSTGNPQMDNYVNFKFVSSIEIISDRHSRFVSPSPALILLTRAMFVPRCGPAGTTQSLLMER